MIHWLFLLPFFAVGIAAGWMAKDWYDNRDHPETCRCWSCCPCTKGGGAHD